MRKDDHVNRYVPPVFSDESSHMLQEYTANYPTDNPKLLVQLHTEVSFRKLPPGTEVYDVCAKKVITVDDPASFEFSTFFFGHVMFGELHEEFRGIKFEPATKKPSRKADRGLAEISSMIDAFSKGCLPH